MLLEHLVLQEQRILWCTQPKCKLHTSLDVLLAAVASLLRKSAVYKVCFEFFPCAQSLTIAKLNLWAQRCLQGSWFCQCAFLLPFSSICLIYLGNGRQQCDRWLRFLGVLPLFAQANEKGNLKCPHPLAILLFTSSAACPEPPKLGLPLHAVLSLAQQVKLEVFF